MDSVYCFNPESLWEVICSSFVCHPERTISLLLDSPSLGRIGNIRLLDGEGIALGGDGCRGI